MNDTPREKWLLLDDSANDRRRVMMALSFAENDAEIFASATVTEALELLEKYSFDLALLDFYLRGNTTSERLIAEIRNRFPALPIVVVSGATGQSKRIYNAGADSITPKLNETAAFTTALRNGIMHAKALRHSKTVRIHLRKTYISPQISAAFRQILENKSGNAVIEGASGMGRTDLARELAERLRKRYPDSHGREVLTVGCAEMTNTSSISAERLLFGAHDKTANLDHGLLKAAEEAILVIDDVHLLSRDLQERLKQLFEKGYGKTDSGVAISASKLRIVFTVESSRYSNLVAGFVHACAAFQIRIPSFASMLPEKREIVEFWFSRAAKERKQRRLRPTKGMMKALFRAINSAPNRVTLRSLVKTIESAIDRAREDSRVLVTESDLVDLAFIYEVDAEQVAPFQGETFSLPSDDKIGVAAWKEIYFAARNGTMEEATALLKKVMIDYAMITYDNNKTRVAKQLGISRQHLYKPVMKELVSLDDAE